ASRELDNLKDAVRPLVQLYGHTLAAEFGHNALKSVPARMVEAGLARSTINARVNRIRRFFRWCVEQERLGPAVRARVGARPPLTRGRGGRETARVEPVAWEAVEAILPHLPEMVRSMVLVGWFTGARPGEIVALTTGMLDRSGEVWVARL